MSDSIRAALERLIARLDETADPDGPVPAWVDSYCAARAALAEQQGEGPSDKELNILWNCSGIADEHGNHTGNIFEFARAVLARWGHQSAPPTEGEVGELVAWLGVVSEQFRLAELGDEADQTDRAATLLAQLQVTPVPLPQGEVEG